MRRLFSLNAQIQVLPNFVGDKPLFKGSEQAAGYDVTACFEEDSITLKPKEHKFVPTGLKIFLNNDNYMMMLVPRSGLGAKKGIGLRNTIGIIDSDYQNEIMVVLVNNSEEEVTIERGERIAQLIFTPIVHPTFQEVESFSTETSRGLGGFGSSGK